MYMCIFSHTFYCCYKPLPLHWVFAVLWSFPFFVPFFLSVSVFFLFSLFLIVSIFTFLKPIFFTFNSSFVFPTLLFPLQLIFNVYKSSSSTSL